jgi:hypothetical protein
MGRRRRTLQPWGAPLPSARLHSDARVKAEQNAALAQTKVFRRLPSTLRPQICAFLSKADLSEFRRYELSELYPETANMRVVSRTELRRAETETLEADCASASAEAAAAAHVEAEASAANGTKSKVWWARLSATERRNLRMDQELWGY